MTKHNSTKSESTKTKKTGSELSSLAHAILKFTDAYVQANRIRKIPFYKSKVLWSGIGVVVAVSGYLINAHAQTKQIEATRLQKEIELKVDRLSKINESLANARIIFINDSEMCKTHKFTTSEWEIDRNTAVQNLINQASGARFIFGNETEKEIYHFIKKYYSISSACVENSNKTDVGLREVSTKIDNYIGKQILMDQGKLEAM